MLITVSKGGGLPGSPPEPVASVDTRRLAPAAARRLEDLVSQTGFFGLPADVQEAIGADLFRYEVTVRDGQRSHRVAFTDDGSLASGRLGHLVRAVSEVG